jgi:RHS repeat-associated protein
VWADYRNQAEGPDVYGQLVRDYTVVIDYRYDPLQRLVGADYSTGVQFGYAYDQIGNRTRLTETTPLSGTIVTMYTYDYADRLTAVTRGGVETPYTWSDRGELLDDGTQEYAWDAAGRLVGVSGPGGLEVAYSYDGASDRVAMVVDGVTTTYAVDPFSPVDNVSQVLEEETGGAETRYFYGLDLLAQTGSTMTTYLGYDALSVRLRLDEDGDIAAHYEYAPFGEVRGQGPAGYGFTGERWDEVVGLLYLRARYYAPEVGRFVSRDALLGEYLQPQTLNRFAYVTNNAVDRVDPAGLRGIMPWAEYLNKMFNQSPYCPDYWHGSLDLGNAGVRHIIECNFGGGGDVQKYISIWRNYWYPEEDDPQAYYDKLNNYDQFISGWMDLFNEILLEPLGGTRHRIPISPSVIKAMAMQETQLGANMGSLADDGIMQVRSGEGGGQEELMIKDKHPFYFSNFAGMAEDHSMGIAAGADYFVWIYRDWHVGNLWESVRQYNGSGEGATRHMQRVQNIYWYHRYYWDGFDNCTCVGARCEEGSCTHPQPRR